MNSAQLDTICTATVRVNGCRTRQRFEFKKYFALTGTWEKSGYQLMPSEVDEFYNYIQNLGWSFEKTFERLTGKNILSEDGTPDYTEIKLVVETVSEQGHE